MTHDEKADRQEVYNEYVCMKMTGRTRYDSDFIPTRKVVVIGDAGVGKSCLVSRFTDDAFLDYLPNIGVDFRNRYIRLDGKMIRAQVWDTAGGERFHTVVRSVFRGAYGVAAVYDVTNQASFNRIGRWLEQINTSLDNDYNKLLIGNKCDLTTQRVVDYTTAKEYADENGFSLVETSAKDSTNVNQAFIRLVLDIKTRRLDEELAKSRYIRLNQRRPSTLFTRGCC